MENNICSNISVDLLAKECNVSSAQLKRVFNKYAGIGVHEYFLQIKVLYAKKLLSNGMTVSEIAEKLSFSSQNYFSVVFKRKVGVSPLQYKKSK
ncbi:MAG: helix-turn-helix transcriptional regulator [Clostridia bacterium]|nr:helix-turn-helix transcriptional regulator [Clostridia bacterium]